MIQRRWLGVAALALLAAAPVAGAWDGAYPPQGGWPSAAWPGGYGWPGGWGGYPGYPGGWGGSPQLNGWPGGGWGYAGGSGEWFLPGRDGNWGYIRGGVAPDGSYWVQMTVRGSMHGAPQYGGYGYPW